ncbi:MAG: hypothetical protein HYX53_05110 [Chloroflexi bacterium]|nr:hypothetical protein [Chloroflexota bacterium]
MRILRLTTSDDAAGRLPPGAAVHEVVARLLHDATGENVETALKAPWPSAGLPELVERWVTSYKPDIVLLKVNAYWFNYLSLPLQLERKLGRAGRPLTKAGRRVGEMPLVARSRAFKSLRRRLLRVFPGATYFTPEAVIASMEDCIRVVLAHEGIGLVVSGPASRLNHELAPKAASAHERRRQQVHQAMAKFCAGLHVPYIGEDRVPTRSELAETIGADGLHIGPEAARKAAEQEAAVFLKVWAEIRGEVPTPA